MRKTSFLLRLLNRSAAIWHKAWLALSLLLVFYNFSNAQVSNEPVIGIPCYVAGDGRHSDMSTGDPALGYDAFVIVMYDPGMGTSSLGGPSDVYHMAYAEEIGSTWGTAFNNNTGNFYTAATIKRHSAVGPEGTGAIYRIGSEVDNAGVRTSAPTLLIDLDGLSFMSSTINTGADPHTGLSPTNGINTEPSPNGDQGAFDAVGKIGIGDIDLTEDNSTLYAINLNGNGTTTFPQLIRIDVSNESSPAVTGVWDISPATTGVTPTNGVLRPWGIGIRESDGAVFISAVTSGENSGARSDLDGYVFELNTGTGMFTTRLMFDLDFLRGPTTLSGATPTPPAGLGGDVTTFNPWIDLATGSMLNYMENDPFDHYPQPILSDLEFLDNGDLLVGVMDRWGMQTGTFQTPPGGTGTDESGRPAGDVLQFSPSGMGWSNASFTAYGDVMSQPEDKAALGAIAHLSGSNEFIGPTVDPEGANNNGLVVVDLTTSPPIEITSQIDVQILVNDPFPPSLGQKGLALGDIEIGLLQIDLCPNMVIDDFDTGMDDCLVESNAGSTPNSDFCTFGNPIGDEREIFVEYTSGPGGSADARASIGAGTLSISEEGDVNGDFIITYDGTDDVNASTVDENPGFGAMDFTGKTFVIEVVSADVNPSVDLELTLYDDTGATQTAGTTISANVNAPTQFVFNSPALSGAADIAAITAISLRVNTTGNEADIILDNFAAIDPASTPNVYDVTTSDVTACESDSPTPSITISLNNSDAGVNYELYRDGTATGVVVAGTGAGISFPAQTDEGTYRVVATNTTTTCSQNMDGQATLTVNPNPTISAQPGNAASCPDGSTVQLSVSATPGNGGVLSYDWQYDNGGFASVSNNVPPDITYANADQPTLNITVGNSASPNTYNYRVVITETAGMDVCSVTSSLATLSVQDCGAADWGDLPDFDDGTTDSYPTNNTNGGEGIGPSHTIISGLLIGSDVDAEADGQPDGTATGDGGDEDGVSFPANLNAGQAATIVVEVVNSTGNNATLYYFIDWNNDGDFSDANETGSEPANASGSININLTVPANAVAGTDLGARFRLSSDPAAANPGGLAVDGEVQDYLIQVMRCPMPSCAGVSVTEN